jgi:tRNA 2-thiouridine synthesizing protein A
MSATNPTSQAVGNVTADAEWDAGDLSCGDLVLALRQKMSSLPPGAVLKVIARDPAAPLDMPAWCRVTGNSLVATSHPVYFIRRKEH